MSTCWSEAFQCLRLIHTLTEPETLAALPGPAKSVATVDIDWYADVLDIFATHQLKDGEFISRGSRWVIEIAVKIGMPARGAYA